MAVRTVNSAPTRSERDSSEQSSMGVSAVLLAPHPLCHRWRIALCQAAGMLRALAHYQLWRIKRSGASSAA
eukprot:366070-Chlamydomonas_euryale.AAC.10